MKLNSRNEEMVALRRQGKTLEEIGDLYGVTRERVRQITIKAVSAQEARRVKYPSPEQIFEAVRRAGGMRRARGYLRIDSGKLSSILRQRPDLYEEAKRIGYATRDNARKRPDHDELTLKALAARKAGLKWSEVAERIGVPHAPQARKLALELGPDPLGRTRAYGRRQRRTRS